MGKFWCRYDTTIECHPNSICNECKTMDELISEKDKQISDLKAENALLTRSNKNFREAYAALNAKLEEAHDVIRFLAKTWTAIDKFVYKHCNNSLLHYPVVQGTANQVRLKRIGKQPYSQKNVSKAISYIDKGDD